MWPQVLLVLLWAVRPFHCSGGGLFDEALMAETVGEAVKLGNGGHHHDHHHPHHWPGKNHPHHHNKHANKGEIVCTCNHNSCVTTNYMCKTLLKEGCFYMKNKTVTSYGCVDQLSVDERSTCDIQQALPKTRGHVKLTCCQSDMCNYEHMKSSLDSDLTERISDKGVAYYDEFWVKVALIAVPLCGGVILVVLVVLACKILQRDSKYEAHSRSSGYMQCHGADPGANPNRHSKARLLLLEDGSPTSEKHVKNAIYKGPQDHRVITWVVASHQGDKPSPV